MAFQKVCSYEPCSRPFSTAFRHQRFCSVSCANSSRTLMSDEDVRAYFLAHVSIPGDDLSNIADCWVWTGHINSKGYGLAFVRNDKIRAHRLGYELFIGPIPDGLDILHGATCKIRHCANPWHVRPGTDSDNAKDRIQFGAQVKGSEHHMAGFTETQALHILQEFHEKGLSIQEIATKRRANIGTIHDIIQRHTWTHVAPGLYPAPGDQRAIVSKAIVREMRRLHEDEGWSYQALENAYHLKYPTVVDICTYRSWSTLPAMPTAEELAESEPVEVVALTAEGVRAMRQALADAGGLEAVKITRFAKPYARKHGMSNMAVRYVLKGDTWKHVLP